MKVKKTIFYILTTFLFLSLFLVLDYILSNTLLANQNCYEIEKYYYQLKKNCKAKHKFKKSFPSVNIYTDKYGLRVSKNFTDRNPNKKNIFIFGDSFSFGEGLEYEETFVGLIEKKLNNYNVYNFGVSSYSPSVYIYKLKQKIKNKIFPEKILLFLDLTDVHDESARWNYDLEKNLIKLNNQEVFDRNKQNIDFTSKNFKIAKEISSILNFNLRILRSKISNSFNKKNKAIRVKQSIQGQFTYKKLENLDKEFWKDVNFEKGLNNIRRNINLVGDISKKYNSEFYLIIYPWAETLEFGENEFSWSGFGYDLCIKANCKLINTIPSFIEYKKNSKNWVNELYFVNDEHFNSKGAKELAKVVINKIK